MKIIRPVFWITGALLIAAAFLLVVQLSSNEMDFSRYNGAWNGTASFFSDLDRHHSADVTSPGDLFGHANNSILFIIAPYRYPTAAELAGYTTFLKDGNTIFLADNFGTGNDILSGIGSRITFEPGNLSSLDRQYPDVYTIVVYPTEDQSPVALPQSLVLNRAAPLNGGTVLMLTSVLSWNDVAGERRLVLGEDMGTFPVMATEPLGNGRVIVLSDPNIFINSMYSAAENGNNRILIRNLMAGHEVLIDQMNSRTADASGLSELFHLARTTIIIEIFIISLLMLAAAWAWKKKAI